VDRRVGRSNFEEALEETRKREKTSFSCMFQTNSKKGPSNFTKILPSSPVSLKENENQYQEEKFQKKTNTNFVT